MIITTSEQIAGKEITETLGLVQGNTVRARNIGRDIFAGLKNIVGGEISEYSKLMNSSRQQATDRMVAQAKEMGADAIVMARFTTAAVLQGASEILAFGTAVKVK